MNLVKAHSPKPQYLRVHAPDPARLAYSLCGVAARAWQTDLAAPNCKRCELILESAIRRQNSAMSSPQHTHFV
jgi:hypothetical protein